MVLHRKLEVSQGDCNTCSHQKENDEDDEEDSIKVVTRVAPDAAVEVVQLGVDRTEGKETGNQHLETCLPVEGCWGNLPDCKASAHRGLKRTGSAASSNAAHDGERNVNSNPNGEDLQAGEHRKSSRGTIEPSNDIRNRSNEGDGNRERSCRKNDVPSPLLAVELLVHPSAHESRKERSQGEHDDERCVDRSRLLGIEQAKHGEAEDAGGSEQQLGAGSQEGAKEDASTRESEHITVDELPAVVLIIFIHALLITSIAVEILLKNSEHNEGKQACEKDDQHHRVKDAQPMDFHLVEHKRLEELHPVLRRDVCLHPRRAVGESNSLRSRVKEGDTRRVGSSVDVDHLVSVVQERKVQVEEEVICLHLSANRVRVRDVGVCAHEAMHGKAIAEELVEVVVGDGLLELGHVLFVQCGLAELRLGKRSLEAVLVERVEEAVSLDCLAEGDLDALQGIRSAVRQRVELKRLRWVVIRADGVHEERHLFSICEVPRRPAVSHCGQAE
mmetsp:Transcript_1682/g.5986  ORF Transcript_1682/g.5986 Transcript_1682/m.5986 type:complete len:501 (+) Transcript_1682:255-1757(+)